MTTDFCRAVERHLCQKNDGHLIRVVGPAFEVVSGWERDGVPLKVALRGIDRYFDRSHRTRPRRRPVRVEFCDTDVQEVFDDWRRALGLAAPVATTAGEEGVPEGEPAPERHGPSLRAHLERIALRLSSARATGRIGPSADAMLDQLSAELDLARARARGLRGVARTSLIERLVVLDRAMIDTARRALEISERTALEDEARHELRVFRERMAPDTYERALSLAVDRLVRERAGLPVLAFV